ncbi:hypothetical protein Ccrd_007046, partial [Cynara cardunculus var. scolymus]
FSPRNRLITWYVTFFGYGLGGRIRDSFVFPASGFDSFGIPVRLCCMLRVPLMNCRTSV